jgi:hypothetical protein
MRETGDEMSGDSDFQPNNKPEIDPVEDGKTTFKRIKVFSMDTRTFSRKACPLVVLQTDQLNSKLIWYQAAKLSKNPIYKLFTEELTEVKKQVDDL